MRSHCPPRQAQLRTERRICRTGPGLFILPHAMFPHLRRFGRLARLALALLVPATSVRAETTSPAPAPRRLPNFVFILADDLGAFDLACDGRLDHRTPHLDRLAAQGTRFTAAYCAQPICSPSRAAILTGLHPARLHLTTYLPGRADAPSQQVLHPPIRPALPLDLQTLPEHLRAAGYATACIGKWHLGGAGAGPREQGFDVVHAGQANTAPSDTEGGKGEFDLTARAEAFLEQHRDRPFFLYLAHHSPHIPYSARSNLVAAHTQAGAFEPRYAALVETLDAAVGQLLGRLDALGLAEHTVVVFTSDNGGLHVPELQHPRITHNGPLRAGKGFLYEGGLRIPLIVRWPGHTPPGRVVADPVSNLDWLPTFLELANLPVPPRLDGRSLAPLLLAKGSASARTLFWHFPHYTNQGGRPGGAIRDGRWKFIEFYDSGAQELYDLTEDPGETRNLAGSRPDEASRLHRILAAERRARGVQENQPNPAFDPARFAALYLDFDPSRFAPRTAGTREWGQVARWRRLMDEAVRKP